MDFHSTNKWIKVKRFRLLYYPRRQATAHHDVRSPISPLCANSADTTTCVSAKTSVNCFSGHVKCFGLCVYLVSSILSGGHLWKALKKFPSVFGGHLYIQEYPSYKRGGPYTSSLRLGVILHVLYYKFRALYFRITHTWVRNILNKYPRFIMGVPISGRGKLIPTLVFTMIPMWGSICLGPYY
jgi:hypothetical protein